MEESLFNKQLKAIHRFNDVMDTYTRYMRPYPDYRERKYVQYWESSCDGETIEFEVTDSIDDSGWLIEAGWTHTEDFFDCCGLW